ncbi:hypothetical protein CONCODRAFT_13736 [Conidiobolus coronatus NRRL 28638]|uniref:CCDC43 PWI-like domain-containing protein n=1 Tax=Conidiobolus coronatus (strain ATCC 28846 / CBS 209.66 / NRRL 28638) TaxID=796925 RepID=A0A137NQ68_CONC2|nr:hypothetical protein CONCODRAFT_13736 [Conidiobolus coronatus NRRL 28638]|eukprot:KXN64892.1 hypothetical protein CONCODRAFT_13736 [Conidiobolus coronatus NRRL 28638]
MSSIIFDFVKPDLLKLSIDDEAVIEYIVGIVEGEDIDGEDKFESIQGYLMEFTEEPTDDLINKWLEKFNTIKSSKEAEEEETRKKEAEIIRQMELVKLKEQAQKDKEPVKVTKKILTEEELAMKRQLLAQYDYEVIVLSDEDEPPKPVKPIRGPPPKPSPDTLFENNNSKLVEQKERMKREMSKKQHDEKVNRDKINLEKQRQEKERKKTTVKQEKRRM